MELIARSVSLDDLLLDPNNYRFRDLRGWKEVHEGRYHEQRVQGRADLLLRETSMFELSELKNSIATNGLVPLEQIVVRVYEADPSKFVVVEGNRRIAAIRWLLEEHEGGVVSLSGEEQKELRALNVLLLDTSQPGNAHASEVLMAIRHVSGVKQWGAYQQASLIVKLKDQEAATFKSVAERLGMSPQEVARRYRAAMALKQMEVDDEYREYAEPRMYAIFHETVAQPTVRDWLRWDEHSSCFTNLENLHHFYSLISGTDDHPAKITSYEHIRSRLRPIIACARALQALLDPTKSMEEASQIAAEEASVNGGSANFELALRSAAKALDNLSVPMVRGLTGEQQALLTDLAAKIEQTLSDHRTLQTGRE